MGRTGVRGGSSWIWRAGLVAALAGCTPGQADFDGPVVAYQNGAWWQDDGFELGTRYVSGGVFVEASESVVDSVVDLGGRWLLPPFGDAHTHNLDGDTSLADAYLREGVFYVQVLTNTIGGASRVKETFAGPGSLDVVYANAGISSEFGHPILAYEPRSMGLDWRAIFERREEICKSRNMEGKAYWFIEDEAELEATWPMILESSPQVLKIFLLRADDPTPPGCDRLGLTGMTPELAARVVEKAREAELPVWAHVETAADAVTAVRIGVTGLAHVPGYGLGTDTDPDVFRLDAQALEEAGARGVYMTPTLQLLDDYIKDDSAAYAGVRALQRANLSAWEAAGGRVVVGSDSYGRTARGEFDAFAAIELWSNAELLSLWSHETPRAIFPGRPIGELAPGFEASWLVLSCNPIPRLACIDAIEGRVKQGQELDQPDEVPAAQT